MSGTEALLYEKLMARAKEAATGAYAPYSGLKVGAALLTAGGDIITGCNIENASYGLSMCAERVALFTAVSGGKKDIAAIALHAGSPLTPCGACRQVMAELAPKAHVVTRSEKGVIQVKKVGDLLPDAFTLKKNCP